MIFLPRIGGIAGAMQMAVYPTTRSIITTTLPSSRAKSARSYISFTSCKCMNTGLWAITSSPCRIVNMSSLGGLVSLPFQSFYAASKFAVEAYTEALRMELKAFGIQVSMVEPGDFSTGFTASRRMTAARNGRS